MGTVLARYGRECKQLAGTLPCHLASNTNCQITNMPILRKTLLFVQVSRRHCEKMRQGFTVKYATASPTTG